MDDSIIVKQVEDILGCDARTARHYLKIFDNDMERAIAAVLSHGEDPTWWGHPWNRRETDSVGAGEEETIEFAKEASSQPSSTRSTSMEEESGNEYESDDEGLDCQEDDLSATRIRADPHCADIPHSVDHLIDDRDFYNQYYDLVDAFIAEVCEGATRSDLRQLISEADRMVAENAGIEDATSDLVNRLSYKHVRDEGRSPLCYAVAKNLKQTVYNLIDLGANISKVMVLAVGANAPVSLDGEAKVSSEVEGYPRPKTALVIAATNPKRDGTEMVRILLSKGSNPSELESAGVDESTLSRGMRYWIQKARRVGIPSREDLEHMAKLPPMHKIHELDYAVVGEEAAVAVIQEALAGRFGNPQGNRKPLVMILLGPPGHGKTYFSSNAARSLVGEDNFLFVACQSIRDDADLFGSRLGGSRSGEYSSDGKLTSWLRQRQGKKCIIFLDEFEKMSDLTSALGWGQAKKIYQSFLEPWNDGCLSDQGAMSGGYERGGFAATKAGGDKIDCSQTIWIMTSNWGQSEIVDFCDQNSSRVHKKIDQKDVSWLQKALVKKTLRPLCMREFAAVHQELKALCRRIDYIIPFLPFTKAEQKVVADIALIERFSLYREPCVLEGPEDKRRSFGNLFLKSTRAFETYATESYDPMQGASGMLSVVQQADGKFQMMNLRNQLGLTDAQKMRIKSTQPPTCDDCSEEPVFWVDYDNESDEVCITQSRPPDDETESETESVTSEDQIESEDQVQGADARDGTRISQRAPTRRGASDDAF